MIGPLNGVKSKDKYEEGERRLNSFRFENLYTNCTVYTRPYPSRQSTALHSPLLTHSKKLAKTVIAQGIGVNVDQSGGVMETGIA